MTIVAVIQSNYIPWKGYFDLIHDVDTFIFYDDVQYTKNDWRNRNRIKTPKGSEWLTLPVGQSADRLICEVPIDDPRWQKKHLATLLQNYARAPHIGSYRSFLEHVYLEKQWTTLSELNHYIIKTIAQDFLGITCEFRDSREFSLTGTKQDRLLDLLQKTGATKYISGPAARSYIDPSGFDEHSIELDYKSYAGYPEYPQRYPPFDHAVSILDLLLNVGEPSPWYIWGWRESEQV